MQFVDHIFIVLLFVVQPIYGYFENRRYEAQEKAGQTLDRIRFYRLTAVVEWAFLAALAAAWFFYSRSIADLGFVVPGGLGFGGGGALLLILTGFLVYSWRGAATASDVDKEKARKSFGRIAKYVPQNDPELRSFYGVSLTAGIVEEIVYRGFVLWYLGQFMPLWAAVVVSSVAFGLAHNYQGASGVLRTGLAGLAFGIFYIVTGSIWLPIIAHVLLDALQGAAVREIYRKNNDALEPTPA
jgi:membrane protease YdiL (CAAX protease family)